LKAKLGEWCVRREGEGRAGSGGAVAAGNDSLRKHTKPTRTPGPRTRTDTKAKPK